MTGSLLPKFPNKALVVVAATAFIGIMLGASVSTLYFSTLTPAVTVTVDYPTKDVGVPFEFFGTPWGGQVSYAVWNFHDGTDPVICN